MEKPELLKEQVAFRCKHEDRAELKRVSESLSVAESDVARAAFREGLKVVSNRGIQPAHSRPLRDHRDNNL